MRWSLGRTALLACLVLSVSCGSNSRPPGDPGSFARIVVDPRGAPWGKSFADVDGDGFVDIVVGGGGLGRAVHWYHYPSWTRFVIGTRGGGDDLQIADVNGDGAPDVVVNGAEIIWYENPRGSGGDPRRPWVPHVIDGGTGSHDLVIADVNGDGHPDVVIRQQLGRTIVYLQAGLDSWTRVSLPVAPDGQGLALADINRDGRVDVVGNGYWLEQPADPANGRWAKHPFAQWTNSASVAVADVNGDGRLDIVLAPSETGPGTIAWFEAPADPARGGWVRHDVDRAEDVHRFHIVDVNEDGRPDIVFAEMHQSPSRRVGVYYNDGDGLTWTLKVLATTGSHNIALARVGNAPGVSILGANWNSDATDHGAVTLWQNTPAQGGISLDRWTYIQVDGRKADTAFGLAFGDIDGDGRRDIVSGRYWYRNPGGDLTAPWIRTEIASDTDAMLVLDVEGDGRIDVIGQAVAGSQVGVFWHKPLNTGAVWWRRTLIGYLPGGSRDETSQGYVLARLLSGASPQLVFSTDYGLYYFVIPSGPAAAGWPRVRVAADATQEGIAAGDVDGDGRIDVIGSSHLGPDQRGTIVAWWQNPGTSAGDWVKRVIGTTELEIDRVRVGDVNGDGRLDAIVTDTDYGAGVGYLYWFEQMADGRWVRHAVGPRTGALHSLDVADFNRDGHLDIVTGEHRGYGLRTIVWENIDSGRKWTPHLVGSGKESHLGAQAVDLDGDGDLDIVSIAWDHHQQLHLWRNDALQQEQPRRSFFRLTRAIGAAAAPTRPIRERQTSRLAPL